MHTEFVIVRFPRKKAYYRVPVNRVTEEAIWRLEVNSEGYYDLVVRSDEAVLWKYARLVALENHPPGEAHMASSRR